MAVAYTSKGGKRVTLLNPAEKGRKYAYELRQGKKYTNSGTLKRNENGKAVTLGKKERAYRSGYLAARKDSAACYKAKRK